MIASRLFVVSALSIAARFAALPFARFVLYVAVSGEPGEMSIAWLCVSSVWPNLIASCACASLNAITSCRLFTGAPGPRCAR